MGIAIVEGDKKNVNRGMTRAYEMLDRAVQLSPDNGTYYINSDGTEEKVSYVEQKKQALGILASLQKMGVKQGDYIVADVAASKDYHLLMWACFYGGFVLTTLPRPDFYDEQSQTVKGVLDIWEMLHCPVMITDNVVCSVYKKVMNTSIVYTMDDLYSDGVGEISSIDSNDSAYVQFSSGSTGNKKGAILSNENLISEGCSLIDHEKFKKDDCFLTWLPHTHNFGAFTFTFISAILACNSWYMSTELFARNPSLFLEKVSEHKITSFCINNLGLQMLLKHAEQFPDYSYDLTGLKAIYIGAEKPSFQLMEGFATTYGIKESVFKPGYGMSETVVAVCCSHTGFSKSNILFASRKELIEKEKVVLCSGKDEDDKMALIEHGYPITNVSIGIFSNDNQPLSENKIGSIRIKGKNVFQGYCNPEDNAGVFCDGWYITGDLGFIRDRKLYIVGRTKDIIIINGINYMLTDMESVIERKIKSTNKLLLISVDEQVNESLVVFVEMQQNDLVEYYKVAAEIRDILRCDFGIDAKDIVPIENIKRNASRKVDRYGMKISYLNGEFDEIIESLKKVSTQEKITNQLIDENKLVQAITECWEQVLDVKGSTIPLDKSYKSLGGNSVRAYFLIQKIEEKLKELGYDNLSLSQDIFLKCSTIREMSEYISSLKPTVSEDEKPQFEDEIAITGLAFRLPNAQNQEELWNVLINGQNCVKKIDSDRQSLGKEKSWNDIFGQIEGIDSFDYDFFNLSKETASFMDPQQRISLEVAYEALDDAGEGVLEKENKNIAIISAASSNAYLPMVLDYVKNKGAANLPETAMIDNLNSTIATRVAKYLNSKGLAMSVDSACSSFLVALSTAEKLIKYGESNGALVIGTNILPSSYTHLLAKKAGILSSGEATKVFAKDADGSLLGEGVVAVYLEGVTRAVKNRKHIYGVIAGSAMNNDGAALSIMAPNPSGQYDVMKKAYVQSGVNSKKISYIEAHGSGTKIGDPIELTSLKDMFGSGRSQYEKVVIGSAKSNFGHALACAGGVGLIKVLMCMKNDTLVPSPNVGERNPLLEDSDYPFELLTTPRNWPRLEGKPRYAGINSFGIGGTNAHVIIKDGPKMDSTDNNNKYHVIVCSAKREEDLPSVKDNIMTTIKNDVNLSDLCYTLSHCRNHYKYRCSFIMNNDKVICGDISQGEQTRINGNRIAVVCDNRLIKDKLRILLDNQLKKATAGSCFFAEELETFRADYVLAINLSEASIENLKDTNESLKAVKKLHLSPQEVNEDYLMACILREIYTCGATILWEELWKGKFGNIISLPSYPFKKSKVWL